jgi:hypothetical protein
MIDERQIGALLRSVALPDPNDAIERTAVAARGVAASRHSGHIPTLRLGLAGAAVVALVGFSFTPPGRALADDIARLVGIGGPPTVDQTDQDVTPQSGSEPIVIGEGQVPRGGPRFEIVAYDGMWSQQRQEQHERDAAQAAEAGHPFPQTALEQELGTCVSLDWPESVDPQGGDFCIDRPQKDPLPTPGHTDYESKLGPGGRIAITGVVGPSVDRVDVRYTKANGDHVEAPVTLAQLGEDLAERAGATERFGFYVAFIPDEDVGAGGGLAGLMSEVITTVELIAYDASGDEVKRLDYGAIIADQVERTEVQADRLEEIRQQAERDPIPLQSAADCPSIAQAFEEAARSPNGIRIAGQRCPSLAEVRESLERFPEMGRPLEEQDTDTP